MWGCCWVAVGLVRGWLFFYSVEKKARPPKAAQSSEFRRKESQIPQNPALSSPKHRIQSKRELGQTTQSSPKQPKALNSVEKRARSDPPKQAQKDQKQNNNSPEPPKRTPTPAGAAPEQPRAAPEPPREAQKHPRGGQTHPTTEKPRPQRPQQQPNSS